MLWVRFLLQGIYVTMSSLKSADCCSRAISCFINFETWFYALSNHSRDSNCYLREGKNLTKRSYCNKPITIKSENVQQVPRQKPRKTCIRC